MTLMLRSMEKNRKYQPKGVGREKAALASKRTKKYSIRSARVFKQQGMITGLLVSLILAVGAAEVVSVDGSIFQRKSVQLSCNQGKKTKGMHENTL